MLFVFSFVVLTHTYSFLLLVVSLLFSLTITAPTPISFTSALSTVSFPPIESLLDARILSTMDETDVVSL